MPRVRVSLRALMAMIAIAAIALGIEIAARRRAQLLRIADLWNGDATFCESKAMNHEASARLYEEDGRYLETARKIEAAIENVDVRERNLDAIDNKRDEIRDKARAELTRAEEWRSMASGARTQAERFREAARFPLLSRSSDMHEPGKRP